MRLFACHCEVEPDGSVLTLSPPALLSPGCDRCACAHACLCSVALPFAQWGDVFLAEPCTALPEGLRAYCLAGGPAQTHWLLFQRWQGAYITPAHYASVNPWEPVQRAATSKQSVWILIGDIFETYNWDLRSNSGWQATPSAILTEAGPAAKYHSCHTTQRWLPFQLSSRQLCMVPTVPRDCLCSEKSLQFWGLFFMPWCSVLLAKILLRMSVENVRASLLSLLIQTWKESGVGLGIG